MLFTQGAGVPPPVFHLWNSSHRVRQAILNCALAFLLTVSAEPTMQSESHHEALAAPPVTTAAATVLPHNGHRASQSRGREGVMCLLQAEGEVYE